MGPKLRASPPNHGGTARSLAMSDAAFGGAAAGLVESIVVQPLDIIKTRFQLSKEARRARSGTCFLSSFMSLVFFFFWGGLVMYIYIYDICFKMCQQP